MAKKPKKPKRPRTLRRSEKRKLEKLVQQRLELAKAEVGGSASRPLEVESAAIVESRAAGLGCPVCNGVARALGHDALSVDGVSLRRVMTRCAECETEREVWLRVVPALLN